MSENAMTPEGLEALRAEIEDLETRGRNRDGYADQDGARVGRP